MRGLAFVLALAACNAGGLAYDDARVAYDDADLRDGAIVADARMIDAEISDDAELPPVDAEILYDAEEISYDAEEISYDAEEISYDAEPAPDARDPTVPSLTVPQDGFAGSWSVSPAGTSCGPGCNQYAAATNVTITLTLLPGGSLSWGVGPCQYQGHQLTCTLDVDAEVIQPVIFYCPTYVVDVVNGDDGNSGTCGAAFKTITKATGLALGFQIISVQPGTYSTASGETFPITIPAGTPLWGNSLTQGAGIEIEGPLVCSTASEIAGVTITAAGETAVRAASPCTIRDSVITGSAVGVGIEGTARLERNRIRANAIGVAITAAGGDLGTAEAAGENELVCNGVDVTVGDGVTASAVGNLWDHDPPTAADVALGTGAELDVSSPTVSEAACP